LTGRLATPAQADQEYGRGRIDGARQVGTGFYAAALGFSRAALYRVFARHGQSVSATIWTARLERARGLLTSAGGVGIAIADVAAMCGFRETPTFSRMCRRPYGRTPTDAREGRAG